MNLHAFMSGILLTVTLGMVYHNYPKLFDARTYQKTKTHSVKKAEKVEPNKDLKEHCQGTTTLEAKNFRTQKLGSDPLASNETGNFCVLKRP